MSEKIERLECENCIYKGETYDNGLYLVKCKVCKGTGFSKDYRLTEEAREKILEALKENWKTLIPCTHDKQIDLINQALALLQPEEK